MPRMQYKRLADDGDLPGVLVYDLPSRIWHWSNALLVLILIGTGYFLGTPMPSTTGDTSALYTMGWLRFAHLAAGQVMAVAFLYRMFWAWWARGFSWQLFVLPFWRRSWSDGFVLHFRWYLGAFARAPRYIGVNPLANAVFFFLFVIPAVLTILTGFAMLAEVKGHTSWLYVFFGWMVALFGNTLDPHLIHRLCMWVLMCFVMFHIYTAVWEETMSRQTLISAMLSGIRNFR